jgi:uncharacterized protein
MAVEFLHGVETIDVPTAGQVSRIVKSSVIGIIGIAPTGPKQSLILTLNPSQDAQFGCPLPGFNIPKSLEIIRLIAGNCPVLVINIFDAATMTAQVNDEVKTVVNGKLQLGAAPIGVVTVKKNDGTASGLIQGTDYSIDAYGEFTALSPNVANDLTLKFSYKKLDAANIDEADLIGEVDLNNVRTGAKLFDLSYNSFGYTPKVLIAPQYAHLPTVTTELRALAKKFRGIALQDAPKGTSLQEVISGRGPAGTFGFNISDPRAILLYPQLTTYDKATKANGNYPFSAFMAGAIAKNDNENGYWTSPSNVTLEGVVGAEKELYAALNDAGCDVNQINAAGITTYFNSFGTGFLAWGNRNASYPVSNDVKNFINIQRASDIVAESMELAAFKYVGKKNINKALIDLVREEGNTLIRVLVGRGVFLPGSKVVFNTDDNPPAQLSNGQVVFQYIYMVPAPAERITFKATIDINLYKNLK